MDDRRGAAERSGAGPGPGAAPREGADAALPGAERARAWMAASPFGVRLGLRLVRIDRDLAEVALPYRDELATLADVVHGGAIGTLIDAAATAAAWSGADAAALTRGATVSLTVNFLSAARGQDLLARARVARRGRSIVFCEVDVTEPGDRLVAQGLVTYKLG